MELWKSTHMCDLMVFTINYFFFMDLNPIEMQFPLFW